jgi:hypothetical protein
MPPAPEQSHANAMARDGTVRTPSTSAAMSLSATAAIQAEPNAISVVTSAAVATRHDSLVSIEGGDCKIYDPAGVLSQTLAQVSNAEESSAALRQNARDRTLGKYRGGGPWYYEIDPKPRQCEPFRAGGV